MQLDPSLTTVSVTTMDGVTVSKSASLKALAPIPLLLRLNTATMEIEKEGMIDFDDLMNEGESTAFGTVKRYIERDTRTSVCVLSLVTCTSYIWSDPHRSILPNVQKCWRRRLNVQEMVGRVAASQLGIALRPKQGRSAAEHCHPATQRPSFLMTVYISLL